MTDYTDNIFSIFRDHQSLTRMTSFGILLRIGMIGPHHPVPGPNFSTNIEFTWIILCHSDFWLVLVANFGDYLPSSMCHGYQISYVD